MPSVFKGVGAAIDSQMSVDEQLSLAGLDWEVIKEPCAYGKKVGKEYSSEEFQMAYRSDNGEALTVISDRWTPYQNRDFLTDFNNFCVKTGLELERAGYARCRSGSVKRVNVAFASAKIPADMTINLALELGKKEGTEFRLIFCNYHMYGKGCHSFLLGNRLTCTNQIRLPKASNKNVRGMVNHLHSGVGNSDRVQEMLRRMQDKLHLYCEDLQHLAQVKVSLHDACDILIENFGDQNKPLDKQPKIVQTCLEIYQGNLDDAFAEHEIDLAQNSSATRQTAYGVLQSVSAYTTHLMNNVGTESQLLSIWDGKSNECNERIFNSLALAYIPRHLREKAKNKQSVAVRAF